MFSVTSTDPLGETMTSASNFSIRSSRVMSAFAGGKTRAVTRTMTNRKRTRLWRRRIMPAAVRVSCRRRVEAYFWSFALCGGRDFEKLARFETQHIGEDVRGKLLDFRVEVADHSVVVAPRVLDVIFDLRQRVLQRGETFDGAQLGVGLGKREETFQRS